jgi:ABC-type branched-subunit amino acid transport system substrate-binding protein/streptogramin lyase/predicted Ser/Thr protein kinase
VREGEIPMGALSVDPRVGTELAGYRIEALVGRGGMGVVYRALDLALDRPVALKILAPELAKDVRFRERFLRESRLAASLDHPSIVPVFDAGEVGGELYIAMRYVEGRDLKRLLSEEGALAPRRALAVVEQVADALDTAHERGLVHRDVKPSNVLIDARGHAYLADFGLSRRLGEAAAALGAAQSIGTVDYVAPEQIRGDEVDGRADLYSLACVLHECLTGAPPFRRSTDVATLYAHLQEDAPSVSGLEPVMRKALAKEPAERFASGAELAAAATRALGLEPRRQRWPSAVAGVGAALLGAALLAFFLTRGGGPAPLPGADTLVRIDPTTNEITDSVAVGRKASGVAAAGRYVWVTSFADGTLWRVDARSHHSIQIPARGSPTDVAAARGSVLVSEGPDRQLVSVAPEAGTVSLLTRLPGNPGGAVPVAAGGERVWFADATEGIAGTVEAGLKGGSPGTRVAVPPDRSSFLSAYEAFDDVAVGEGAIWVAGDAFGRTLWRLDPASKRVVATIELPFVPGAVAAGEGGVWVTSLLDDTVVRVDPASNRPVATIPIGPGVNDVAAGAGAVWVTSSIDRTVSRIDPRTDRVVARTPLDRVPERVAVGAGGVWVTTGAAAPAIAAGSIGIGVLADCKGPFKLSYEDALGGAQLALLQHGGRRAGPLVTDGVTGVRIGGRPVQLAFGCTSGVSASTLAEARRLVEQVGVRILIGPLGGEEGLALQGYERRRPDVAFVNGSASTQQLDPAPNFFSFHLDGAEWMAGLAAYAYNTLGWRRAVTVVDLEDSIFNWTQAAGFIAEFCSLGGTIADRVWVPSGTQDYSEVIARMPTEGVDGVVAATGAQTTLALARGYPVLRGNFGRKLIAGALSFGPELEQLGGRLSGAVGGSPYVHQHDRYAAELRAHFPQLKDPLAFDLFYHDAMEATVEALERVGGDLSGGERRFMAALASTRLSTPIGPIRLDATHEAVGPNYLFRFRTWTQGRELKRVDGVEHTFGGHFQATDPPPGETTPACRHGNPPPWAR